MEKPTDTLIDVANVQFPPVYQFLFEHHPYKVVPHGRGAATSWSFARALLLQGLQERLRIPCCRETMTAIKDSVHATLKEQIEIMGLERRYAVQQSNILGTNGTEITFHGLKTNPRQIKSLEGAQRVWVEEAEFVSAASWNALEPTIFRRPESELWVSYNPNLETDETHQRFTINPRPQSKVVHTTWRDNPWFPPFLRTLMEDDYRREVAEAEHIWEGKTKTAVKGGIYTEEIAKAVAEGRIGQVPVDRTKPADTFWDLGYGDLTVIWFAQAQGGWYNFVDYLEGSDRTIHEYVIELQNRGYMYGAHWLPHDAVDTILHKKLAGGDTSRSIEQLMRAAGLPVRVAAKTYVIDGINAVRTLFPQCRFDAEKCRDGLQALRHYRWKALAANAKPDPRGVVKHGGEPEHDWASHSADGLRTAAMCIKLPRKPPPKTGGQQWRPASMWS